MIVAQFTFNTRMAQRRPHRFRLCSSRWPTLLRRGSSRTSRGPRVNPGVSVPNLTMAHKRLELIGVLLPLGRVALRDRRSKRDGYPAGFLPRRARRDGPAAGIGRRGGRAEPRGIEV